MRIQVLQSITCTGKFLSAKRFRALKLWFVIRNYGVKGLQAHIRKGVHLAKQFEAFVASDDRFEIPAERHMGMVVFRLKGENEMTEKLLKKLNGSGKMHAVPSSLKGKYVIRFTVTSQRTTLEDVTRDWWLIRDTATELSGGEVIPQKTRMPLKQIKEQNPRFGTSMLLSNIGSNSAETPKMINGSFAALFENKDVTNDFARRVSEDLGKTSGWTRSWILTSRDEAPINPRAVSTWGPRIPPAIAHMSVSNKRSRSMKKCSDCSSTLHENEENGYIQVVVRKEALLELQKVVNGLKSKVGQDADVGTENLSPNEMATLCNLLVTCGIVNESTKR